MTDILDEQSKALHAFEFELFSESDNPEEIGVPLYVFVDGPECFATMATDQYGNKWIKHG